MYKRPGASIWRGDLTEGFLRYRTGGGGGLIFGGAYTLRGLISEFYGRSMPRRSRSRLRMGHKAIIDRFE